MLDGRVGARSQVAVDLERCHALLMFEEELFGGNTSVVVRVGDTVRRPVGPWTPAVHDLLNYLAAVGFRGAPRVRGIDELNREVLEFVSGEVGILSPADPLPWWFRGAEACWSIGRWIREFQSAQEGFLLTPPSRGGALLAVSSVRDR